VRGIRRLNYGLMLLVLVTLTLAACSTVPPLGLYGNGHDPYPNTLNWAAPFPWTGNHLNYQPGDRFVGYLGMTAAYLNEIHQGSNKGSNLNFVSESVPSNGILTVSVQPTGRFSWQAAARGKDGRCYGITVTLDPNNVQFGSTGYYRLPSNVACTGANVRVHGSVAISD